MENKEAIKNAIINNITTNLELLSLLGNGLEVTQAKSEILAAIIDYANNELSLLDQNVVQDEFIVAADMENSVPMQPAPGEPVPSNENQAQVERDVHNIMNTIKGVTTHRTLFPLPDDIYTEANAFLAKKGLTTNPDSLSTPTEQLPEEEMKAIDAEYEVIEPAITTEERIANARSSFTKLFTMSKALLNDLKTKLKQYQEEKAVNQNLTPAYTTDFYFELLKAKFRDFKSKLEERKISSLVEEAQNIAAQHKLDEAKNPELQNPEMANNIQSSNNGVTGSAPVISEPSIEVPEQIEKQTQPGIMDIREREIQYLVECYKKTGKITTFSPVPDDILEEVTKRILDLQLEPEQEHNQGMRR